MASASNAVYAELRRQLMSGAYLPGERLREERIASDMAVSRTPVRSAIQKLVADGLVRLEEHRGAVVIGWTDRDITEAFEVRSLLEPYAAGIAALNATPAQVDTLESLNEQMHRAVLSSDADRIERVQQLNNQFHHMLIEASQSARLKALVGNFIDMPIIIGSFYFYSIDDMLTSVAHHRQIILALRSRNQPFAEVAVKFHLAATRVLFENQRTHSD
jgi:DNA-binding GntR family transcriptional regulator